MIIVDMSGETHITEATLLTNARAISRLTDGRRYKGRILRTILRGATVWDGAASPRPPAPGASSPRRTRDDRTAPAPSATCRRPSSSAAAPKCARSTA